VNKEVNDLKIMNCGGVILLFALMLTAGCVRGREENVNTASANANLAAAAMAGPNKIRVSADMMVRYVGGAHRAVELGNWQDAFNNLKALEEKVDSTLSEPENASIAPQLNEMKRLITRATNAVDSHGSDALSLLQQLQTAAFALKVQTSQ
jgi:hypothetical protein